MILCLIRSVATYLALSNYGFNRCPLEDTYLLLLRLLLLATTAVSLFVVVNNM